MSYPVAHERTQISAQVLSASSASLATHIPRYCKDIADFFQASLPQVAANFEGATRVNFATAMADLAGAPARNGQTSNPTSSASGAPSADGLDVYLYCGHVIDYFKTVPTEGERFRLNTRYDLMNYLDYLKNTAYQNWEGKGAPRVGALDDAERQRGIRQRRAVLDVARLHDEHCK